MRIYTRIFYWIVASVFPEHRPTIVSGSND
jgi:hypothetical protein